MSETLTDAERAEYDAWLQKIPSGGPEEALWNLMRLQIKHDTATIRTISDGAFEFLGVADARMAELVSEARAFRADGAALAASVAEVSGKLDGFITQSTADRAELHTLVSATDARVTRVERRVNARVWALAAAVAVLLAELVYRYVWPLVAAALLSLVLMGVRP